MSEIKLKWLDFVEAYREARLLWDPQDEHRNSKVLRAEAYSKLLEMYKKIDKNANFADMKNKLINMRTAYNRQRKKVLDSIENGNSTTLVHTPTLWYFDIFHSFLDTDMQEANVDMLKNFKGTNSVTSPAKRLSIKTETHDESTNEEEDEDTEPPPAEKKRRIYELLQKQENFVDTASQMLQRKEREYEITGKDIGLQLHRLDATQRSRAQKLISNILFYGKMGKLQEESYVYLNNRQTSPEIQEIEYLEDESDDNDDHFIDDV